ncbi:hypothetical protein MPSEU_000883600 [Mayamaea pseudoterrestris]|nr:hypothetical protein MPSEU_000883600 [Mayamaea pseudoterrestris]
MMDLQSLMDSWSLEEHGGGASRNEQQIEDLADRLKDRLEIDLGREQFRDLAAKLIQLNLEKRQTSSSSCSSIGSGAAGSLGLQRQQQQPTSTSTWHSSGQENSAGFEAKSTNLQTLFDPPAAAAARTPVALRGRQRERQSSLPQQHTRSSTPLRSFFGFGAKPATASTANTSTHVRARSPSPFRIFTRSNSSKNERGNITVEEEKKEHDTMAYNTTTAATSNTSNTAAIQEPSASTPVRGVARHFSGRASPMLDPSAEKPCQPARAKSPFANIGSQRANSPVPTRQQTLATPAQGTATTRLTARPGLQDEDSEQGGRLSSKTTTPTATTTTSRRANTTDDLDDNSTASTFTLFTPDMGNASLNRPNHGAEQDDDEAGQQPKTRHRKSMSEPMQLDNIDFGFDFSTLHIDKEAKLSDEPVLFDFNKLSVNDDTTHLPPNVTTRLTPPQQQFRTPKASTLVEDANAVFGHEPAANAFQTGRGKNRRKGGTPPFVTVNEAPVFDCPMPSSSFPNPFASAPARESNIPQQPIMSFASGTMPLHPVNHGLSNASSNTVDVGFSIGGPPVNCKGRGRGRVNSRRISSVKVAPTFRAPAPAVVTNPPSPMEVDSMEITPPPKFNVGIHHPTDGAAMFHIGTNIPRSKQATPIRNKTRAQAAYSWHTGAKSFAATAFGAADSFLNAQSKETHTPTNRFTEGSGPEKPLAPSQDEKRAELVAVLRDEARNLYEAKDFCGSIVQWTKAIKLFDGIDIPTPNDTLSVLLSNRAACFVMMEAFEPAIRDCIEGLLYVSEASGPGEFFSHDSGLPLRVKLLLRLGKAYLKSGDHVTAVQTLDKAIEHATRGLTMFPTILAQSDAEKCKSLLNQMVTEATLTKLDAERLADLCASISTCVATMSSGSAKKNDRRLFVEALAQVKSALSVACGSVNLFESKVTLLVTMNRWREVAGFLERLACSRVPLEALFHEIDLASHNPLPGVPKAKFLSASSFAVVDETDEEAEVKLNSKACGEAVLRLPHSLTQIYIRALRLEERYPSAEAALKSIEELVESGRHLYSGSVMHSKFSWLSREFIKLNKTKKGREYGDKLFRLQDYDLAAKEYGKCLAIDGEDLTSPSLRTAGGRLHAVLYCNRAACFMALHRYNDALDECAAALRIHPRYMKALLRRARCYSRLSRCEEAIREYEKWRELAAEGKSNPKTSSGGSPCWFDLPREVTAEDVTTVLKELDDVHIVKRRMDAAARETENRRNEWQRRHDNMHSQSYDGSNYRPNHNAQQRRQDWHNQRSDPFHWDSFAGRHPRSGPSASSKSSGNQEGNRARSANAGGSHSAHQRSVNGSPGSDLSISHYAVLGIDFNATARDVKKAYRAKALTEHPDKNIHDSNAADKFRRIQMAYEILSDAQTRYKYDTEHGFNRRR